VVNLPVGIVRYRLTGDKKWQDKGWRMFTSWVDSCTAGAGFSSVGDVSHNPPHLTDNMVSRVLVCFHILEDHADQPFSIRNHLCLPRHSRSVIALEVQ
jgi:hypothetical protein